MEIEIKLEKKEVTEIVKAYALSKFPINTETHDVSADDYYGGYKVEITDKVPAKDKEGE